jgi:S-methylmethionine-dependent homocysteine/selenocysteine methylase
VADGDSFPDVKVKIIDGGMGRELRRIGAPFQQPEWSAQALMDAPDMVRKAHDNFIAAGAEVIIVNSYAVVPFHIGPDRFHTRGHELIELAGRIAREAADQAQPSPLVAGSVPPLFGSYEPDNFVADEAPALYDTIVRAQAPFVDLWILETMSSIAEATAALAAVEKHRLDPSQPIWLSFCLPDLEPVGPVALRSGESITALAETFHTRIDVFSINCSLPERIDEGIPQLRDALAALGSNAPIAAYANAFEPTLRQLPANSGISGERDELTAEVYANVVDRWIELGASIVGGCCGIHPEHIAELTRRHQPTLTV